MKSLSLAGAILAGGRSSRMGTPKEAIVVPDGRTMLQVILEALALVCEVKLVSGGGKAANDLLRVTDRVAGVGPLAGIEAILASGVADRYLIAACDQPLISEQVLKRLSEDRGAEVVVPRGREGFYYPLPGVYDAKILPIVTRKLDHRELSLVKLLGEVGARALEVSEEEEVSLRSFNTPEELSELFQLMKSRP